MKSLYIFLIMFIATVPSVSFAQQISYKTLINFPNIGSSFNGQLDPLLNFLYALSISLAALLAVIKIVVAGMKYMLSDVVTTKGEAISDIRGALLGLIIVISAVLILTVINPNIVTNVPLG